MTLNLWPLARICALAWTVCAESTMGESYGRSRRSGQRWSGIVAGLYQHGVRALSSDRSNTDDGGGGGRNRRNGGGGCTADVWWLRRWRRRRTRQAEKEA